MSSCTVQQQITCFWKTNNSHLQTGQAKRWIDATYLHNEDPPLDEIDSDQQQHDKTDHEERLDQEGSQ